MREQFRGGYKAAHPQGRWYPDDSPHVLVVAMDVCGLDKEGNYKISGFWIHRNGDVLNGPFSVNEMRKSFERNEFLLYRHFFQAFKISKNNFLQTKYGEPLYSPFDLVKSMPLTVEDVIQFF